MAMRIIDDSTSHDNTVANGTSLVWDFDGVAMTRKLVIAGCRAEIAAGTKPSNLLWVAATTFNFYPGLTHPNNPDFMVWTAQVDSSIKGNDKLSVTIRYRNIAYVQVRLDGNVIRETTSLDSKGDIIKIGYAKGGTTYKPCVGEVEAFRPGSILEFERYELRTKRSISKMQEVMGFVNSKQWQGCEPFTWLCMARKAHTSFMAPITSPKNVQYMPTYVPVRYAFQYYGWQLGKTGIWSDWRKIALYKNWTLRQIQPEIDVRGEISASKTEGNGWKRVEVQGSMDFADLNLPQGPFF